MEITNVGDGLYEGFFWTTPVVRKGDTVTWKTEYGSVELLVIKSTPVINVDDMTRVYLEVIQRYDSHGNTLTQS